MSPSLAESWFVIVLLGLMSAGVLVMAATGLGAATDLRRTMRQLSAILPACDKAIHEARRTMGHIQQVVTRADHATRHLEGVVHKACDTASEVIEGAVFLKDKAERFFAERFGNGARSGPRHRYHHK